jgi:integral membrane sensor domain MASE1
MAGGSLAIRWDRKDLLALQCKVGAMLFVVFAIVSLFPTIHASGTRSINTTDLTNSIILLFLSLILQISGMIIEYKYLKQK